MARFQTDPEVRSLGEALAALRREQGLSQAEAGARAGMTSQGWGLYESGKRPGLFRPDVQRRLTAALGASPEALGLYALPATAELAKPPAGGVSNSDRDFDGPPTARLQLEDDSLAPWARRGVIVEYIIGRPPRPWQGCVIERQDGAVQVRIFVAANWRVLTVRGGSGGLDAEELLPLSEVWRISAVTARLEP